MIGLTLKRDRRSPTWHHPIVIAADTLLYIAKREKSTDRRRVACFQNRPSPIRKEKGRSLLLFHGRSSCGSYDRWRSFESPSTYSSVCSIRLGCLSLQLGGRFKTTMYIQMARCIHGDSWNDGPRRVLYLPFTAGWRTEPRLLPPARLAGGDDLNPAFVVDFLSFTSASSSSSCIYLYTYWYVSITVVPMGG